MATEIHVSTYKLPLWSQNRKWKYGGQEYLISDGQKVNIFSLHASTSSFICSEDADDKLFKSG